ncbi:MAG: hypothetical protein B7Y56_06035 [Gallionellales bacterium 35-53-114]|jgi:hypothetical protein|nr:MAG: hypothetical protein B7Y56_06035 [Gallionellales bacterium 35-53-114]OYZ63758.1 MAG: hypothetical protein B7Y04_07140 [Gallionellales bacterium 24-53-125]OZB09409.1 MAG: hypothetical protein B7X61_07075 [Gallionellales bacterium 39-52-133]
MRVLFVLLFLLTAGFFAFMQWGGMLTGAPKNGQQQAALNPEKIKLLDRSPAKQMAASAVLPLQSAPVLSATLAASAPAPAVVALASSAPVVTQVSAPPVPAVNATAAKAVAVKTCMEWGEFSGTDLERSEKELADLKLGSQLGRRTVEYASGYWVYIPPLSGKEAVNKKIAEIRAAGLSDFYVVRDSRQWYNAISLGVFKTEEAAKSFQGFVHKKGLRTAKVGERKRKLKFTVFVISNVDATLAARLSALRKNFAHSELKKVPCAD